MIKKELLDHAQHFGFSTTGALVDILRQLERNPLLTKVNLVLDKKRERRSDAELRVIDELVASLEPWATPSVIDFLARFPARYSLTLLTKEVLRQSRLETSITQSGNGYSLILSGHNLDRSTPYTLFLYIPLNDPDQPHKNKLLDIKTGIHSLTDGSIDHLKIPLVTPSNEPIKLGSGEIRIHLAANNHKQRITSQVMIPHEAIYRSDLEKTNLLQTALV